MSNQWDQLKSTLGLSALVSFYGIVGLLVWFLGPSIGLGGETERIIIIALILLTWPFAILIASYRKKREEKLAASDNGSEPAQPKSSKGGLHAPARAYDDITRGAEEAVQWLRSTKLGGGQSGDATYSLPWFVVVGPQGSGKTSLLLSSNLDFHVVRGQRSADQNLVRPTRDCEWRVTDWAVLLDTAGRYQIEGPDSGEWSALIETIKKHRKARPLDGFLIAVDAARILASSEAEIEQQAKTLRARLDEVITRSQVRFPVYLVFTHLETIGGFEDFFATLDAGERGQVWGATIPLEQSPNAHALFDVEFDYLYEALMRRRLLRLSSANRPDEQLSVFDFPLLFGDTRRKLGLLVSALFRPNPFSESPLLRGFYFTSSPSENHRAAYSASAARVSVATQEEAVAAAPQVAGAGYFTESLFRDVLLRDKDLAASFQSGQKRPERLRNIILGAGAALLLAAAIWMVVSYARAQALVSDARKLGESVTKYSQQEQGKEPIKNDQGLTTGELTAIDLLRQKLEDIDNYNSSLASWIFSINSVKPYAHTVYFDAINYRFFKPTVNAIEGELQSFTTTNTGAASDGSDSNAQRRATETNQGQYYDLLKAYLMLSNSEKAEPTFLEAQLKAYWKKQTPQGTDENISLNQLGYYTKRIGEEEAPHIKSVEKIVADAQQKLREYSVVDRVYKNILTEIDSDIPAITLESILQRGGNVGLTASAKVPGSFTLRGYKEFMSRKDSAAEEVGKDAWVMGPYAKDVAWQASDTPKLQEKYLREYVDQWKAFLKSVSLAKYSNMKDAEDALGLMSAASSPLVPVAKEAVKHTSLAKSSGGLLAWIGSLFSSSKGKADIGVVDQAFEPLAQFVSGEDEAKYRTDLKQLQEKLYNKTPEQLRQDKSLPEKLQSITNQLKPLDAREGSREASALLRQPVERLNELLNLSNYQDIKRIWQDQIFKEAQDLQTKFPFTESEQDAPVGNLAAFLNPVDGRLSKFVKENLGASFDAQWKLKEDSSLKDKLSDEFKKYLGDAYQLREVLFGAGGQVDFGYTLVLQPTQGADVEIEIDGQKVSAPGNLTAPFKWSSTSSGAKITVTKNGEPKTLERPGKWGVFKLFKDGRLNSEKGEGLLTWTVGGVPVRATVKPDRLPSLFQTEMFTKLNNAPKSPGE